MSRIGNAPVTLGDGVSFSMEEGNIAKVKGPKGELEQYIDPCIKVEVEDGEVKLSRESDHKDHRAKHGLYRSLVANMVEGVTNGYEKKLELVGVGFRAQHQGQLLKLSLGYSHAIHLELPKEIKVEAETVKGQNPIVTLSSIDKQLLGAVASKIRSLRKPEPYKGKGVRYQGEYIRRKAGKAAAK